MTLALVRRPTCEAKSAARKASPSTYTPPWKYMTIWRGSIPSTVISAVRTPPSAASATVTSAGSGCADNNSRSRRRCSATSLSAGNAPCRRIASRFSCCSILIVPLRSRSGVHVRPVTEIEPDRLHHLERRALGEHVRCGEHAGVLLDHGRRCGGSDLIEVALDGCPGVLAVFHEVRGRIDARDRLPRALGDVCHVLLMQRHIVARAKPAHVSADEVLPRGGKRVR